MNEPIGTKTLPILKFATALLSLTDCLCLSINMQFSRMIILYTKTCDMKSVDNKSVGFSHMMKSRYRHTHHGHNLT